ncbi:hypothetical protein ACJMK2_009922 [Sinanodonta woodiana]|uniref:Uncharacterized protein n=1 Tax=Sinanodonta woodiana TaxID=1069815 RepID=A0ABD3VGU2_SINWO
MQVKSRNGNSVVLETNEGARYSWNVSFVKKFVNSSVPDSKIQIESKSASTNVSDVDDNSSNIICGGIPSTPTKTPIPMSRVLEDHSSNEVARPRRERKLPSKFADYEMT